MAYRLEHVHEAERLEKQSLLKQYDIRDELRDLSLEPSATILDAGCGSGLVSRFLAERHPNARVFGCDLSEIRILQASDLAYGFPNIKFQVADLTALPFPDDSVDFVICRYVLEHLSEAQQTTAAQEMLRCLRPGGKIFAIDVDGWFHNLHPTTPLIQEVMREFHERQPIDLLMGRKMPRLLRSAGFRVVNRRIDVMDFQGEDLLREIELLKARFKQLRPFLSSFLGNPERARRFTEEILARLREPETVLFYNKFIVQGVKEPSSAIEPFQPE